MTTLDHQARVLLALHGLIPIAWLDARERAARLGLPLRREHLIPDEAERGRLLDVLVTADDLATGDFRGKSRGSLAALAKAIVTLAAAPGGVKFAGWRWQVVGDDGELRLEDGPA